ALDVEGAGLGVAPLGHLPAGAVAPGGVDRGRYDGVSVRDAQDRLVRTNGDVVVIRREVMNSHRRRLPFLTRSQLSRAPALRTPRHDERVAVGVGQGSGRHVVGAVNLDAGEAGGFEFAGNLPAGVQVKEERLVDFGLRRVPYEDVALFPAGFALQSREGILPGRVVRFGAAVRRGTRWNASAA